MNKNVYDKALERIRYLFDEFEDVSVGFSGGKDSTIIYNLAMQVAKEKNRLPLSVLFLDQEAEWSGTIDIVKEVMYNPDVKPYWYQMPILLDNATSWEVEHLDCWAKDKENEWLRKKDPISIKENKYNHVDFSGIFTAIFKVDFKDKKHCHLVGVRSEESPGRHIGLTSSLNYKDITWGNKTAGENNFVFYPIYDWSYTDVWKAIQDNNWSYNKIYDYQYRYGVPIQKMRVSNLHHETAVHSLFYLQEVDKELYNKLAKRLQGVSTANQLGSSKYFVKKLPFMFKDWSEYRDYLVEKLVTDKKWKKKINSYIKNTMKYINDNPKLVKRLNQIIINSIMTNDRSGTKMDNFSIIANRWLRDKRGVKR